MSFFILGLHVCKPALFSGPNILDLFQVKHICFQEAFMTCLILHHFQFPGNLPGWRIYLPDMFLNICHYGLRYIHFSCDPWHDIAFWRLKAFLKQEFLATFHGIQIVSLFIWLYRPFCSVFSLRMGISLGALWSMPLHSFNSEEAEFWPGWMMNI